MADLRSRRCYELKLPGAKVGPAYCHAYGKVYIMQTLRGTVPVADCVKSVSQ